ncbi:protein kinase domain-containing protein [Streptomyces aurantiacus]|uniref:protein kinase domain-containing protein n=1 Tax=Streptomyces aurantiacus TaxID=47760 RepID=UPI0027D86CF7|nr:protein kinase [Streptomyces aurantiacus]
MVPGDHRPLPASGRDAGHAPICGGADADAASLLVAELTADAAVHGRVRGRDARLDLTLGAVSLLIEVTDAKGDRLPGRPPRRPPAAAADGESGRGLLLVESLADDWYGPSFFLGRRSDVVSHRYAHRCSSDTGDRWQGSHREGREAGVLSGSDDQQGAAYAAQGAGRVIAGRYRLTDQLGRGGMGTVWRAHDQLLARDVAAKELHVFTQGDEDHRVWLRRAVREARVVARVPHPHVVGVHDLVEYEDRLWIVMELIDGPSLAQLIAQSGPLEPTRVAALGLQLLGALDAVHAVGALHRDVKPANVLLRRDGSAVLTDFGIAVLDDGELHTNSGEFAGSAEYMAPERINGGDVGPASDLWSLAATLVTAATGASPFRRKVNVATLHAVAYEEPNLPPQLGPLLPVVEALLRKAPEERLSLPDATTALRHAADGGAELRALPSATVRVALPAATPAGVSLADAETRTHHHALWADQAAPTSRYDAETASALMRRDTRRRDQRVLGWVVSAVALLVAGTGVGLFLAEAPPFDRTAQADAGDPEGHGDGAVSPPAGTPLPPTPVANDSVVHGTEGWQRATETPIEAGDTVTVRFTSGQWTVDDPEMPLTGPDGYDPETDQRLTFAAADCKVNESAPFGALLGRFTEGGEGEESHIVGEQWTFEATAAGTLELRINDGDDGCVTDNAGDLSVTVSVAKGA